MAKILHACRPTFTLRLSLQRFGGTKRVGRGCIRRAWRPLSALRFRLFFFVVRPLRPDLLVNKPPCPYYAPGKAALTHPPKKILCPLWAQESLSGMRGTHGERAGRAFLGLGLV